jgi:hypothetical protein
VLDAGPVGEYAVKHPHKLRSHRKGRIQYLVRAPGRPQASCGTCLKSRPRPGHPGEFFGYLAHARPFLEGNDRTIPTIFAELTRRAGFHVEWEAIDKDQFLETLTRELLQAGRSLWISSHFHIRRREFSQLTRRPDDSA